MRKIIQVLSHLGEPAPAYVRNIVVSILSVITALILLMLIVKSTGSPGHSHTMSVIREQAVLTIVSVT